MRLHMTRRNPDPAASGCSRCRWISTTPTHFNGRYRRRLRTPAAGRRARATRPCSCAATKSKRMGLDRRRCRSAGSSPSAAHADTQRAATVPPTAITLIERDGVTWHEVSHTMTTTHPALAAVTDRITERNQRSPRRLPAPDSRSGRPWTRARPARVREPGARLRGLRQGRQASPARHGQAEHRHRRRLQRHAVRASALRAVIPPQSNCQRARPARIAQFAGGVPAMCDGVTQGRDGMELSLFSRDAIAMATGDRLGARHVRRHALLGICDKIVPGLLIGALRFRAPADGVRARRADALRPAQRRESPGPPAVRRGQGDAATNCSTPRAASITAPEPAPSTAPPTPTRC